MKQNQGNQLEKFGKLCLFIMLISPIAFYYLIIIRDAQNIPKFDDYWAALDFLNSYVKSDSITEKIGLLFAPASEHRSISFKALLVAQYIIGGEVNFKILIIVGNFILLGLTYLFYLLIKNAGYSWHYLVPIVYVIFHLQYYDGSFHSIVIWQAFITILLVFLALFALSKEGINYFLIACFFSITATFSVGNGMLVFGCGVLILTIRIYDFQSKNKKIDIRLVRALGVWLLVGACSIWLYFFDLQVTKPTPPFEKLILNYESPDKPVFYPLAFISSYFNVFYEYGQFISFVISLFLFSYFLYLVYRRYFVTNPLVFSLIVFVLLTALTASLGRSHLGIVQAQDSRYRLYPAILFVLYFISFLQVHKEIATKKSFYICFLLLVVFVNIFSYSTGRLGVESLKKKLRFGVANFYQNGEYMSNPNEPNELYNFNYDAAKTWLKTSEDLGIYKLPKILYSDVRSVNKNMNVKNNNIGEVVTNISLVDSIDYFYVHNGLAYVKDKDSRDTRIFFVLTKTDNPMVRYYFDTKPNVRNDQWNFNYFFSGFTLLLYKRDVTPGKYHCGILILDHWDSVQGFTMLGDVIEIEK